MWTLLKSPHTYIIVFNKLLLVCMNENKKIYNEPIKAYGVTLWI